MPKLCAYFRVSTAAQGRSGLGLEGQEAAVLAYAKATGGAIVRTFREVESGTRSDRPELAKALAHTRRIGGTLVVAKLDRLSRNVAFLSALMESGAEFACCDNPNATRLTIHILAAVAEDEARRISERTKAALGAARARGTLLGSHRPGSRPFSAQARERGNRAAAVVLRAEARRDYADLEPRLAQMRGEGRSLKAIADALNAEGERTRTGAPWGKKTVQRVLVRMG